MILHDLKQTGSTVAKQMILKRADTFDQKMFEYAYNSNKVYHLKFNSINWKSIKPLTQLDLIVLDNILGRYLIGNEARQNVHNHCSMHGDLVKLIINKDLDCGTTATTLNKVFGKSFIFQFKAQKAVEIPIKEVRVPVLGQIKYNGIRTIAHITKKQVYLRTYNGKFFTYTELEKALLANYKDLPLDKLVLDGELTIGDSQGTNHTDVGGKVNSSIKTGIPIAGTPFTFTVFDALPLEDFDRQICNIVYEKRLNLVYASVSAIKSDIVKWSTTYEFKTHKDIEDKFNSLLDNGYEGMILKHADHKYKFRKTKDWIKLKDVKTCDIKCISYEEGEGKYVGKIGSLMCRGQVEGKEVIVGVGSGLTDADRAKDPEDYIGQILEIKYNSLIVDRDTCEWSLFLPRFVAVRFDK